MSVGERAIVYHLVTKVCQEDLRYVQQLIKTKIVRMHKTSMVFKGNVRRIQAHCIMSELYGKGEASAALLGDGGDAMRESKELEIEDCLIRAIQSFEQDECVWGLGLTHLQESMFLKQKMDHTRELIATRTMSLGRLSSAKDSSNTGRRSNPKILIKRASVEDR